MDEEGADTECPVCYEALSDNARTLSCSHAFCHDCLVRTFVSVNRDGIITRDSIICPVCRHVTFITKLHGLLACTGEEEEEEEKKKNAKILEVPSTSIARSSASAAAASASPRAGGQLRFVGRCVRWISARLSRQRLICPKDSLQVFIISDMGRPMAEDDVIEVGTDVVHENRSSRRCLLCTTSHCLFVLLIAFTLLALVAATLPWVLLA